MSGHGEGGGVQAVVLAVEEHGLQTSGKSGFVSVAAEITTLLAQMDSYEYVICITEEMRAASVC